MTITKVTDAGLDRSRIVTPIIINGDMSVAQRATSVTGVTSGTYKTIDRFRIMISGAGTWTLSQSTTVPTGQGFNNSFKYDCTTADASLGSGDILGLSQKIEGFNQAAVKKGTANAEKTTLAFWVRSNKTGTYIAELYDDQNTRQVSKSYTIDSANTWEKKVIVFPADTSGANDFDNTQAMQVNWWLAMGSDYTSGTLSETWTSATSANRAVGQVNLADNTDNEWYCTGVQLEVGEFDTNTIPTFPFESFENNLQKCKRYYESFGTFGDYLIGYGYGSGSDTARTSFPFTVEKRATPTMADVSSSRQVRINWTSSDGTAVNQNSTTQATFSEPNIKNSGYVQIGGYSSIGGGQHGYCRMNNATTTYEADAEL
tara:strand:- start:1370 stop:2485 length:1116 start_codon:yes stop_codon:yes gene_type:complete